MKLQLLMLGSLKTRVMLLTLVIFVASIWVLAISATRLLQSDMKRLLGEQQYSTVTVAANAVNDDFNDRMQALEAEARKLDSTLMGNPSALQAKLEDMSVLQQKFNAGVWVSDATGTAIADFPITTKRIGVNYLDRDFMFSALKLGKTSLESPVIGKKLNAPIFVITTPIRDAGGHIIGTLAGGDEPEQSQFSGQNSIETIRQNRRLHLGGSEDPRDRDCDQ